MNFVILVFFFNRYYNLIKFLPRGHYEHVRHKSFFRAKKLTIVNFAKKRGNLMRIHSSNYSKYVSLCLFLRQKAQMLT